MKYVFLIFALFLSLSGIISAVDINNCSPTLSITSAGSYILLNNIASSGSTDCIDVKANHVLIDCNGYSITNAALAFHEGTGSTCYSNITIKNCNILGTGGIYFQTGYEYGGMGCGNSVNDMVYNNTFNISGTAMSSFFTSNMNFSNNVIYAANGIIEYGKGLYGGDLPNIYNNNNFTLSGWGFQGNYNAYGTPSIVNNSNMKYGSFGLYLSNHGQVTADNSIFSGTIGGYTFNGNTPSVNHSTFYVTDRGFTASWAAQVNMDYSQVIASGTGYAISCDAVGSWPYYGSVINHANLTATAQTAVHNGNMVYGIGCRYMVINNSYIFSNNSNGIEEYAPTCDAYYGTYQNTIVKSNTTNMSAIVNYNCANYINVTVISKGVDIRDYSHTSGRFTNIIFNSTGFPSTVSIINSSNAMNFTSSYLPFNYTAQDYKYINISSPDPFSAFIRMFYTNLTYNESLWKIAGWDGAILENLTDSTVNETGNYVQGTVSYTGIFILIANSSIYNYTPPVIPLDCSIYGNCTVGSNCTQNSDCASGICFNGKCIANNGCTGSGCTAIPDLISAIGAFFSNTAMIGFMFALIILSIGAYIGFRIAGSMGSIIICIIIMMIISFMPSPFLPWWLSILCILGGIIAGIFTFKKE